MRVAYPAVLCTVVFLAGCGDSHSPATEVSSTTGSDGSECPPQLHDDVDLDQELSGWDATAREVFAAISGEFSCEVEGIASPHRLEVGVTSAEGESWQLESNDECVEVLSWVIEYRIGQEQSVGVDLYSRVHLGFGAIWSQGSVYPAPGPIVADIMPEAVDSEHLALDIEFFGYRNEAGVWVVSVQDRQTGVVTVVECAVPHVEW